MALQLWCRFCSSSHGVCLTFSNKPLRKVVMKKYPSKTRSRLPNCVSDWIPKDGNRRWTVLNDDQSTHRLSRVIDRYVKRKPFSYLRRFPERIQIWTCGWSMTDRTWVTRCFLPKIQAKKAYALVAESVESLILQALSWKIDCPLWNTFVGYLELITAWSARFSIRNGTLKEFLW